MARKDLLWADGSAGAVAGVVMLAASAWLAEWYRLPRDLLILMGWVNLAYAAYSLGLASRRERPRPLLWLLIVANGFWALLCLRWAFVYVDTATWLGMVHLVGEALFVGGLAGLEWRWRESLSTR